MSTESHVSFYAHGKLLLTGEYFVIEGARALALPVRFGQWLTLTPAADEQLHWRALDEQGREWFAATYDPHTLEPRHATDDPMAWRLQTILEAAIRLQPAFREKLRGTLATTRLEFPRQWGLGSSSTLLSNIARWAGVDPFALLEASFGGSGYDIAAATLDGPFVFWRTPTGQGGWQPHWQRVPFDPPWARHLWFVWLENKQDSREGIRAFKAISERMSLRPLIQSISRITEQTVTAPTLEAFEELMRRHEEIVAHTLSLEPVQQLRFPDYEAGIVKSLGAWGGDFVLVTSRMSAEQTRAWFARKGYETCLHWSEMVRREPPEKNG